MILLAWKWPAEGLVSLWRTNDASNEQNRIPTTAT
jgi:hypothetical protein